MTRNQFIKRHPKHYCAYTKRRYRYNELVEFCKANHNRCGMNRCNALKMLMDRDII